MGTSSSHHQSWEGGEKTSEQRRLEDGYAEKRTIKPDNRAIYGPYPYDSLWRKALDHPPSPRGFLDGFSLEKHSYRNFDDLRDL